MLDILENEKYISLATYKKNGNTVQTPVWFVVDSGLIYVITRSLTGKVKRLKNNPEVKIAPCTFGGKTIGEWIMGTATKIEGNKAQNAIKMRKKKYGFRATIAGFASRGKGDPVVYSIKLDSN